MRKNLIEFFHIPSFYIYLTHAPFAPSLNESTVVFVAIYPEPG